MDDDTLSEKQQTIREKRIAQLRPFMYQKGTSGNPAGRPPGKTLKEYTREKLAAMTDEEREDFLEGLDKKTMWEMAEGKADTKMDIELDGKLDVGVVILPAKDVD